MYNSIKHSIEGALYTSIIARKYIRPKEELSFICGQSSDECDG
jgi:hypothetical protein